MSEPIFTVVCIERRKVTSWDYSLLILLVIHCYIGQVQILTAISTTLTDNQWSFCISD